jgi:hypothetical protein
VGDAPPAPDQASNQNPADQNQAPPPPQIGNQPNYPNYGQQPNGPQANSGQQPANQPAPPPIPPYLTIPAGTFITVRVNQMLSSDRNQVGDAFSATLVQPIVVNGVVVAEPGQTLGGRVYEVVKAGRIEGVSRLGIQLTQLTLVDGQQLPIQCQLISRKGPTSVGQDAGVIAGTTGLGAAIGAAAGWGKGAAIGAGAGAAAGLIGVLVSRGHPSIVTPEQVLTFRLEAPLTISTTLAPQAFHYVQPNEYDHASYNQPGPGPYAGVAPAPAPPPPYYAYPYPYPYPYYYPYYWGPSFAFYWGPGFWWGGHWYRGYYGHPFRR